MSDKSSKGKVFLTGAGPGDPELLTLKAKRCIETADVIIYDYLANEKFLAYASAHAEIIYVGKKGGDHTMKQENINKLIINKALEGKDVVRLKGGDPFIFGRGGEEAEELISTGVEFEIIPGISSAVAVPAYAGIPLTHRNYSSMVSFITGHEDPNKPESSICWQSLGRETGTLVFLMGVENIKKISEKLILSGRDPDTPVAVIRQGTTVGQRTVSGNLSSIAELTEKSGIKAPAIIVVGEVVKLRNTLNWFENKPLFGKKVIVTRTREQSSDLLRLLGEAGADCIEFPTIEVTHLDNYDFLIQAFERLDSYNWIIFTSINGVNIFFKKLYEYGWDSRKLGGLKIAAIGSKTAAELKAFGINPDLIPDEYRAESIITELTKRGPVKGLSFLIPRAETARETLPGELEKMGAFVDVIPIYRTITPTTDTSKIKELLSEGNIDLITFTSSSTVQNFIKMFRDCQDDFYVWMKKPAIACIGPITANTASNAGFTVAVMPETYTIEALVSVIVDMFSKR